MPCPDCMAMTARQGMLTRCSAHPLDPVVRSVIVNDKGGGKVVRGVDYRRPEPGVTLPPRPRATDPDWPASPLVEVPSRIRGLVPDPVQRVALLKTPKPIQRNTRRAYRGQGSVLKYPGGLPYALNEDPRPWANRGLIKGAER